MHERRVRFHFVIHAVCAMKLVPMLLLGQGGVILTGVVEDESGAAVAGAKVALVHQTSTQRQETTSEPTGIVSFRDVSPGSYFLSAEASGFNPHQEVLTVHSQEPKPFKIKLKVGSVKTQVTVTLDQDEEVSTSESSTASTKFDDDLLGALPTNADDIQALIDKFVFSGAQGTEGTAVVVDGAEGTQMDLPSTAIRRVRVNRNPYSAAFQRPGTGRVEISTKRGHRSRYEGSLAMTARNSLFDARNAFAKSTPDLDRRFVQTKFGGPFLGRRSSFYLAAERLTDDESEVVNAITPSGPFVANVPARERRYRTFTRLQWWPNELHTLYATYDFNNKSHDNDDVGGFNLPDQGVRTREYEHKIALGDTAIVAGTRNELLFTFQKEDRRTGNLATAPAISVNDAFTGGPSQSFGREKKQTFDLVDNASHFRGRHSFLFGGRYQTKLIDAADASNFGGTFEFSSLALFAAGTPYVFRVNQGDPNIAFTVRETAGFLQDEIRVGPSLNMTLGLRYSWQSTTNDRNNLAPRFAFAFAPGQKKQTVLRGGAGIFHDDLPRAATRRSLLFDGVRLRRVVISNPSFPNPFLSGTVLSSLPSATRVALDVRSPYLFHTGIGLERELWHRNSLSMEYTFLRGMNLFRSRNINAPLPATGLRPDPNFLNIDQVESTGFLRSHALTITFSGRLGRVFEPYAKYFFSKNTDNTSGTFSLPANNYDLRPEMGPSDFDRRHRFNFMGVLKLPKGFQVGTVLSLASGAPFNITTGFDDNGDTVANDRPAGMTRNAGRGPGTGQLDLRIKKRFVWNDEPDRTEQVLEVSVDAFNLTNHTNVSNIVGVLSSPFFGRANSAEMARRLQFSVKYEFPD